MQPLLGLKNNTPNKSDVGFTLVELLIVIAILATISAILVLILNPVEYLRRARDSQRLKDYALINQAVNFYSYNSSVGGGALDLDGPNYSGSCVSDNPASPRIFVSVPNDNGEADPEEPVGWTYARTTSTDLRDVNGEGWLPIDFTDTSGGIKPLNILPVDPINTFDSGFYYTYTCGSWELNMRFESEKYQELAESDSGNESGVYELGSDLTTAPVQAAYHPITAVSAPTLTFSVSPTSITSGNSASLTWLTTNADSCAASGAWSGAKAISGAESVSPTANATYTLDCTGPGGSIQKSASVTVTQPPLPQTISFYPIADSANPAYRAWTGGYADVDEQDAHDSGTTRIYTLSLNAVEAVVMGGTIPSGEPSKVTLVVWAKDSNPTLGQDLVIKPRLRFNGVNDDGGALITLTNSYSEYRREYTSSPDGTPWTWGKIINATLGNLEGGVILIDPKSGGYAEVTKMYIEVEYTP